VFIREPLQFQVILRNPERVGTTKNPKILRGVYFEFAEGLRMTISRFCMDTNEESWSRGFARED